jgi:hypothetical protein
MRPAFAVVGSPLGLVTDANADAESYAYGVTEADLCAGWDADTASANDRHGPLPTPPLGGLCVGVVLYGGRSPGPRPSFAG